MIVSSDKKKNGQEIGLVFGTVLTGIALFPILDEGSINQSFAIAGFAFLIVGLILPKILHPVYLLWMKFALLLSKIVTPIVMGVVFFGVLTPVNLFLRLTGKDLLQINSKVKGNATFWKEKSKDIPFDMRLQF